MPPSACTKLRTASIIEQIVDHAFGQPFGFGDIGANGRAIAALVRDRDLDAAHFLELVRQHALIQEFVPILDPGDAELAAGHQADDARIGRAGAFGGFDQFARVRRLFAVVDVAQPRHRFLRLFAQSRR
jgi:hypothetical protein